ncbi:MAG: fibronectin type III-like domain-contianing protein, partial [Clostridia bacterium]|nr:fibronectin type III-like domain-contianing protein [Clostridia bacterium]
MHRSISLRFLCLTSSHIQTFSICSLLQTSLFCRRTEATVKELAGFARVSLRPGEEKQVSFTLRADQLA